MRKMTYFETELIQALQWCIYQPKELYLNVLRQLLRVMKKSFLLLPILLINFLHVNSQMIDSMMKVYAQEFPQQKIQVHFDKDIYRAGETIWFKGYLLSGFTLSTISKNFYAELVNEKGDVVQRKVYPVIESSAAGYFDIPENTAAGNLVFRAYTTWMLNFDTAFIFQKQLWVTDKNGNVAKNTNVISEQSATSIQFFPEGGNLVNSLESVIAFKANNNQGLPVFVKGNIVSSKGKVITSFAAKHDGLGTFTIIPEAGETYNALWTDASEKQQTTLLPAAKGQGLVLHMPAAGRKKVFILSRTDDIPRTWRTVNVIAQLGQEKIYKAKFSLQNIEYISGTINTENLPSGILQVTVFSETWEPVAERIVMINNNNYLFDAKVNTVEINTNKRAKNSIEIEVGDTILSNMSVSVTDAGLEQNKNGDNIISRLLLTGDIKGYVHNPSYYFSNNSDSVAAHLDLVLLTHGWRRYNWSDMASGKKPVLKFPGEDALSLTAKVTGVSADALRADEALVAAIKGSDTASQFLSIPKTGKDEFSLNDAFFFDTVKVFYEFLKNKKLKDRAHVLFDNNFYKGSKKIDMLARPWNIQNTDTTILNRTRFFAGQLIKYGSKWDGKNNVLETVTVKTRVKSRLEQLDEKYTSGMFRNADGFNFDLTGGDPVHTYDILTYLQVRVPGVQVTRIKAGKEIKIFVTWRGSETALFINEIQTDVNNLINLSVSDIAYIKVIRPPFNGVYMGGGGGAIAVYTRKGGDEQMPAKGLNEAIVTGYSSNKQFYSPDYATPSVSSGVVGDYRSTLFWDPAVSTGPSNQKVKLEFYNNDITKSFRVVLEGVNETGKMIRIEKVVQTRQE